MKNDKKYLDASRLELRLQLVEEVRPQEIITSSSTSSSRSSANIALLSHILHKVTLAETDDMINTTKSDPVYWN